MQGGHAARITGVACSPDGAMIASASEDGTIKLWSTNGTLLRTLTAQACPITAIAWSPDGTKIAAGTYSGGYIAGNAGMGLTYLWQAPSGWTNANVSLVRISTNRFGNVTALAFSADSSLLASGCNGGSNLVDSVANGSVVASRPAYNPSARPAAVTSVAFSSSGMMASGCEDATIRVYDSSWNLLWIFNEQRRRTSTNVTAVAFSPDGTLLATASLDQTVKIWSTSLDPAANAHRTHQRRCLGCVQSRRTEVRLGQRGWDCQSVGFERGRLPADHSRARAPGDGDSLLDRRRPRRFGKRRQHHPRLVGGRRGRCLHAGRPA